MDKIDKKDILEKFKVENVLGDERENYIDLKSNSFGIIFSSVTFIIIFILSKLKGLDYDLAKIMFLSILLGNSFYKFLKARKSLNNLAKFSYISFLLGGGFLYIAFLVEWAGVWKIS